MEAHPDDVTAADDMTLVTAARAGDRLAFGILYLRHHAAAWRVACVVSRFSPDAELAVIEGFTRVFSALPAKAEDFAPGGGSIRPYVLACVRQCALDRARAAGRAGNTPAPLAGLAPNGELVLSSLEHHVARGALASLPERARTALWLSEVEAMTPAEIAALVGGDPKDIPALVGTAQKDLHAASQAALVGHEVRAECRFTVANLEGYDTGALDPAKGVLVRAHLDDCPTCRMRLGELANGPATLAAAVPAAPLLGGEAQHHWLTAGPDATPAQRWLPPVLAAATPADLPRPARRLLSATAEVPALARRAGRTVRPVLPVLSLVVAWLAVMLSLPKLLQPDTAPGPGGMAMPAVQAYVPDYLPGTGTDRPAGSSVAAPARPGNDAGAAAGTELALQFDAFETIPDRPAPGAPAAPEPAVKLAATNTTTRRTPARKQAKPASPKPAQIVPAVVAVPVTVAAAVTPAAVTPAAVAVVAPVVPSLAPAPGSRQTIRDWQRDLERRIRRRLAPLQQSSRPGVASLRSNRREEPDGRAAREPARRRHPGHAESA